VRLSWGDGPLVLVTVPEGWVAHESLLIRHLGAPPVWHDAPVSTESGDLVSQLADVIAWEIHAQAGTRRPLDQVHLLIADSLLDFFEIQLKPGASVPESTSLAAYEIRGLSRHSQHAPVNGMKERGRSRTFSAGAASLRAASSGRASQVRSARSPEGARTNGA
jgi:hypothetical protein